VVSSAGDVNADGFHDFLIGTAPNANVEVGTAYLVFGQKNWTAINNVYLETLGNYSNSLGVIFSAGFNRYGDSFNLNTLSAAGDVNGDNFADFLLGSPDIDIASYNGYSDLRDVGTSYLMLGQQNWTAINNVTINPLKGSSFPKSIVFTGSESNEFSGQSLSLAGDVNGDGYSDFLIGTELNKAYLILGSPQLPAGSNGTIPLSIFDNETATDNEALSASDFSIKTPRSKSLPQQSVRKRGLLMMQEAAETALPMVSQTSSGSRPMPWLSAPSLLKHWDVIFQGLLRVNHHDAEVSSQLKAQASARFAAEDNRGLVLPELSQSEWLFDSGQWDMKPSYHEETGAPLFTYRVFSQGSEVGSAIFYQHPLLCRDTTAQRHNVLETRGVLSQMKVLDSLSEVEELCASLPPSDFEHLLSASQAGLGHGALRGLARLAQELGNSYQLGGELTPYIYQTVYYGLWFGQRLSHYCAVDSSLESSEGSLYQSSMKAAADTVGLALTNTVIAGAGRLLRWSGEQASELSWHRTGDALKWLGEHSGAAVFAANSYQRGVLATSARVVSGVIAEEAVVSTGSFLAKFWSRPQKQEALAKTAEPTRLPKVAS